MKGLAAIKIFMTGYTKAISNNENIESKNTGRDESIDVLRGIGMLCVMLSHLGCLPESIMKWITPFFVPVFFFVSGYLKKDFSMKGAYVLFQRFKRLILSYLGFNLVLILASTIIHHWQINEILFSIKGVLYSRWCLFSDYRDRNNIFFFTASNSPLWFLTGLFTTEIFASFLFSRIKNIKWQAITLFMLCVLGYLCTYIPILLPWSLDTAAVGVAFMLAGYYSRIYAGYISGKVLLICGVFYSILVYINPSANMSVRYYGPWTYGGISCYFFVIAGISGSILVKWISERIVMKDALGWLKWILVKMGKDSIYLLAFHWFIFCFCDIIVEKLGIRIGWDMGYAFLKMFVAVISCTLMANIIYRTKCFIISTDKNN